jgi:phenylacetate-coenzyme A ligase PaaK-like adenylate-forming protein
METGDALLSDKINIKKCKIGRTGGTTGPPLRIYRDQETRSWALAAYYRFYNWMGIEPGMPEVELWGSTEIRTLNSEIRNSPHPASRVPHTSSPRPASRAPHTSSPHPASRAPHTSSPHPASRAPRTSSPHPGACPELVEGSRVPRTNPKDLKTFAINRLSNFRSYNAFSFNDAYLEEVVKKLQRFRPKLIRGYLSAILLLADYIKRNNIKGIHPIAVSSTSETLFPEYRRLIEEVFQAPLFNQYGCGECNSIAFECKEHNGMHITLEHCILEADEKQNLIVTNLDNHSQPFIRYKNGDRGVIDQTPCACGNASPRLTELHGRANENIILKDGSSVNGIFFANLLDQTGFINNNKMLRFQIVQDVAGEIRFKAEVKREMEKGDLGKLKDALMPFFNKVNISQHQFLDPGPAGKFRYIISTLN